VSKPTEAAKITTGQHLAAFFGAGLMKFLGRTCRVRIEDVHGFCDEHRERPLILCLWHNRLLGGTLGHYRVYPRKRAVPLSVLTSASKDGGWLAAFMQRFRMGAIRGSSSRRGVAALLELARHLRAGGDVAITPDGPRGPNYSIAPGVIYLAQREEIGIVPMEIQISRHWRIGKKWDALWVPKPFSSILVRYHAPLIISPDKTALESESARLDAALGPK
jgi:lysophospholipid acyltransferase (LPLAT)-like uncharacterized protein